MHQLKKDRRTLILSITKKCNLGCIYCRPEPDHTYDSLSKFSNLAHFDKDKFDTVLRVCEQNNINQIILTGGEPTEYPYFLLLLEFLNEKKLPFSILTNGVSKHWPEVLSYFKKKHIAPNILLSVELVGESQEELRMCTLPFQLINDLSELGVNIELKVNLHKKLLKYISSLDKMLDFWIEKNIKSIRFQPIVTISSNKSFDTLSLDNSCLSLFEKLICLKKREEYKNFIRNTENNFLVASLVLQNKKIPPELIRLCNACNRAVFMRTDNEIFNCFKLLNKKSCLDDFDFNCSSYYP